MNLNDHIKEIEKEFDEFSVPLHLDNEGVVENLSGDLARPSIHLKSFLTSKLREIATATLAANQLNVASVEILPIHHETWCDAKEEGSERCNCNQSDYFYLQKEVLAALSEAKKRKDEYLY